MEIKATLKKPYTENQRIDFIVENNHNLGYEIKETKKELQAWGLTQEEKEEQEKQQKILEIDSKISELETLIIKELRLENQENIQVYNDVIKGLEETKKSLISIGE
jgi:hypothetical protein